MHPNHLPGRFLPTLFSLFALPLFLLFMGIHPALAQTPLRNGGFEGGAGGDGRRGGIPEWTAYETGYDVDRQTHRGGDQSLRCDSLSVLARRGAVQILPLNQMRPTPLLITGWSRADQVDGGKNPDYAIYADLTFADNTHEWGLSAPFRTGTHDWERRELRVTPRKPIKTLALYALFRQHVGTAWFDDFYVQVLDPARLFDGQNLAAPARSFSAPKPARPKPGTRPVAKIPAAPTTPIVVKTRDGLNLTFSAQGDLTRVRTGERDLSFPTGGGFFARDVANGGPIVPMRGLARAYQGGVRIECASTPLRCRFNAKVMPGGDALTLDGEITDVTGADRALTIYFALPVRADGWQWGQDIRQSETIQPEREYSRTVGVNIGATGTLSQYPFGCLSSVQTSASSTPINAATGLGIASQMDWPSVYRIFYSGQSRQFVIAWDFALTAKTAAWPAHNARFRASLFRLTAGEAVWGFRAATKRFYRLNAPGFARRGQPDGGWLPFVDPATITNVADFGFAYHEGDNSVAADDALGLLSLHYSEPMTHWLALPPELPRTYETALAQLRKNAESNDLGTRDPARAALNTGTRDENGRFNLEFRNEPWTNGAVFVVNPNPELPATTDQPSRASLLYTFETAARRYPNNYDAKRTGLDGEYLDSLESWSDTQDYRYDHLRACPYPIPFDTGSRQPVLPQWYSTHTFARFASADLHNRRRLLMANTTPVRFSIFAPLLDVMGIEVNWLDANGQYRPDGDDVFNLRRTLSAQKPYCLLMNADFNRFDSPLVERYFQRCLFYGVFPGMFSANASDNNYWQTPHWYNRDRALFQKYLPLVKRVSQAGWEPITQARSDTPSVFVERYGARLFTLRSAADQPKTAVLTLSAAALGLPNTPFRIVNLVTGTEVAAQRAGSNLTLRLTLQPDETAVLEIR